MQLPNTLYDKESDKQMRALSKTLDMWDGGIWTLSHFSVCS